MKRYLRAALVALLLGSLGPLAVNAQVLHHQVVVHNESDAWAWITVYKGAHTGILAVGCVPPKSEKIFTSGSVYSPYHSFSGVPYDIRVEAERKDCAHPVMLDRTLGYDGKAQYYLHGSGGRYVFDHTP